MQSQAHIVNMIGNAVCQVGKNNVSSELGLYELGSGFFSTVYKHPIDPNLVVKIGGDTDDAWLDYATFCLQFHHTDEKLLKVLEVRVFNTFYVAIMERLDPAHLILEWSKLPWEDRPNIENRSDYKAQERARSELYNAVDYFPNSGLARCYREIRTPNDLHSENVMMRGDVMVVTDPWSNGATYYQNFKAANGRIDITMRRMPMRAEFVGMDFHNIEQRVIAHQLEDMAKMMAVPNKWLWPMPKIGDKVELEILKNRIPDAVVRSRPDVVKDGSPASIRAEKENHMLRVRSQHDNLAFIQGVQRSLLPVIRSRRLQAARSAIVRRVEAAGRWWARTDGRSNPATSGLHARDTTKQDAMAA